MPYPSSGVKVQSSSLFESSRKSSSRQICKCTLFLSAKVTCYKFFLLLLSSSFLFVSLVCAAFLMRFSMSILMYLLRVDLICHYFSVSFPSRSIYIVHAETGDARKNTRERKISYWNNTHTHTYIHTYARAGLHAHASCHLGRVYCIENIRNCASCKKEGMYIDIDKIYIYIYI